MPTLPELETIVHHRSPAGAISSSYTPRAGCGGIAIVIVSDCVRGWKVAQSKAVVNGTDSKQKVSHMRHIASVALLAVLASCGGGSDTTAPPPPAPVVGPASVTIQSVTAAYVVKRPGNGYAGRADSITIRLRNSGGAGTYILEFWAYNPNSSTGPRWVGESLPVAFTQGYDETVLYEIPDVGAMQSVKVRTQPINVSAYTQTDCKVLRADPTFCP